MTLLLEPDRDPAKPPDPAPPPVAARSIDDCAAARAVRVVDHSFHLVALFARAGVYALLAAWAHRFACAGHLLAGLLCGDFVASLANAARNLRRAPQSTIAEAVLLTGVFLWWWSRYAGPTLTEDKALFFLAAFGVFAPRLLLILQERE